MILKKAMILKTVNGSTRLHSVENPLWNELWTFFFCTVNFDNVKILFHQQMHLLLNIWGAP
jgi:hypothetical protein